jgi:hypothetical protein
MPHADFVSVYLVIKSPTRYPDWPKFKFKFVVHALPAVAQIERGQSAQSACTPPPPPAAGHHELACFARAACATEAEHEFQSTEPDRGFYNLIPYPALAQYLIGGALVIEVHVTPLLP